MIKIDSVFFSCKHSALDEKIILNNINLSIPTGDSVLLAGNNGSGKTLLLKTIVGEIAPLVGSVTVDDRNILEYSREEIFNTITYISGKLDGFIVNDLTFVENLYLYTMHNNSISPFMPLSTARKIEIIDTIRNLNLGINIEEVSDKKMFELPNYYKHILILAIGVLKQPKVLLIDDVFSEIDGNDIERVFPILTKICDSHKFTVLMTTDNPYLINKICNRVIILSNGKIIVDDLAANVDDAKLIALFNNHFHKALNKTFAAMSQQNQQPQNNPNSANT